VEHSIGVVTALNPLLGYEKATELAAEALQTGRGIVELVREKKLLSEEEIQTVLNPKLMTGSRVA
jgi:aspartate ammonia-lyase